MAGWLDALSEMMTAHPAVCLVTVLEVRGSGPREAGAKMAVAADGSFSGSVGGGNLEHECRARARELLADAAAGESVAPEPVRFRLCPQVHQCCGGTVSVLFEVLARPVTLTIFGAGHVARELADVLRGLEFGVVVVDARAEWNTPERFPHVRRVLAEPVAHARGLAQGGYALVMTHDHDVDFALLEVLLQAPLAYVGLIGSQTKRRRALARLDPGLVGRLVSPIGLAIGGKTPREIAISVAAELVAVRNGTLAGPGGSVRRMWEG